MSFAYKCTFVVDDAKVPSTQTNFPVLVSVTDNTLKTIGNGGQVQSSSGYDIRFFSDSGLSSAIPFELEYYNASTGQIVFWVKIASLTGSGGGDTTFYAGFGDAGLTTNASSTSTWDSHFTNVYHLKNGASLSLTDSTSSGYNGTGVNTPTATSGQIDGAINVSAASNQYFTASGPASPIAMTYSAWINSPTFVTEYAGIVIRRNSGISSLSIRADGKLALYELGTSGGGSYSSYDDTGSHTMSTNTWYYIAVTYDTSSGLVGYVNAAVDGTDTSKGDLYAETSDFYFGFDTYDSPNRSFDGKIDEIRISDTVRTANWITTEYNNQSAPTVGNFYTSITFAANGGTAYTLIAGSGTFTITGTSAALRIARKIAASSGSYSITGTAVGLKWGHSLGAGSGSFTVSGTNTGLQVGRKVGAAAGSFVINGTSVGLKYGHKVSANSGSYVITGTDVALNYGAHNKFLTASSGTFIITGSDVTFIYVPVPDTGEHPEETGLENYLRRYANDRTTLNAPEDILTETASVNETPDDNFTETYMRRYLNDNV